MNFAVAAAHPEDAQGIWDIRYHPLVNEQSLDKRIVSFVDHQNWFLNKYFGSSDNKCLVLRGGSRVFGYCRFDDDGKNHYLVSIAIHPNQHHQGLGRKLLLESMKLVRTKPLLATIIKNNESSKKLFSTCGFFLADEDENNAYFRRTNIRRGLKMWTSNCSDFSQVAVHYQTGRIDFIELYNNPRICLNEDQLSVLKILPVTIHNTNDSGWHEFNVQSKQLKIWKETLRLADRLDAKRIVVHPGRAANLDTFQKNLKKIDDPRIILENMAGVDILGQNVFARTLPELLELKKLHPICFDFEKAVKSACYQKIDYQKFVSECVSKLKPTYFHLSGGDKNSPTDEHRNLWEANFDIRWIRDLLEKMGLSQGVDLVFETPKTEMGLENDWRNMSFFESDKK